MVGRLACGLADGGLALERALGVLGFAIAACHRRSPPASRGLGLARRGLRAVAGYLPLPLPRFLQVGGGSGLSGLHGHPDGDGVVVVVAAVGGGGAGFVAAGGGVVFFGVCCWVLGVELLLDGVLLSGVELSVELAGLFGVELIQEDVGVRLSGSSSSATPWIAMPTSTPSNADPSTAEPPAAHSARTAVLLKCSRLEVGRSRSSADYRSSGRRRTLTFLPYRLLDGGG
jgi:hypothetical protein